MARNAGERRCGNTTRRAAGVRPAPSQGGWGRGAAGRAPHHTHALVPARWSTPPPPPLTWPGAGTGRPTGRCGPAWLTRSAGCFFVVLLLIKVGDALAWDRRGLYGGEAGVVGRAAGGARAWDACVCAAGLGTRREGNEGMGEGRHKKNCFFLHTEQKLGTSPHGGPAPVPAPPHARARPACGAGIHPSLVERGARVPTMLRSKGAQLIFARAIGGARSAGVATSGASPSAQVRHFWRRGEGAVGGWGPRSTTSLRAGPHMWLRPCRVGGAGEPPLGPPFTRSLACLLRRKIAFARPPPKKKPRPLAAHAHALTPPAPAPPTLAHPDHGRRRCRCLHPGGGHRRRPHPARLLPAVGVVGRRRRGRPRRGGRGRGRPRRGGGRPRPPRPALPLVARGPVLQL